ncbi:MAG TPA: hypothetical protein VE957_19595 [Terriglobales bacterium]|nr:hypothetical protein [Terriglobales bacterium]
MQKIGGWKTAAMFKRYAFVSDGDMRSAISRLEQARLEQIRAENIRDFSHDSLKTGGSGARVDAGKVN